MRRYRPHIVRAVGTLFLDDHVLHICIPAYNEAQTIGVLLWRIRTVFQSYSREYEVVVYNDGSTDATAETIEPYGKVLPLTVLGGSERRGYAAALDALCRNVSARTRYPRRDAMIVMQGDFTDQPEYLPELVKRFEGGADVIVAERSAERLEPPPARLLRRVAPWVTRPFVTVPGITDPFGSYRLYRITVVRDLLKEAGEAPVVQSDGWAANIELLVKAARVARRMETVAVDARYDLRARPTRVRPFADLVTLSRFGWSARGRQRQTQSTS
jgi:glycosyltransferase involved in cell wall biosynthesis